MGHNIGMDGIDRPVDSSYIPPASFAGVSVYTCNVDCGINFHMCVLVCCCKCYITAGILAAVKFCDSDNYIFFKFYQSNLLNKTFLSSIWRRQCIGKDHKKEIEISISCIVLPSFLVHTMSYPGSHVYKD